MIKASQQIGNLEPAKLDEFAMRAEWFRKPAKPALLLKRAEASKALAISPRKLWGMTASGEIPHIRLGRCVRYPFGDLQRWIDSRKKGGAE